MHASGSTGIEIEGAGIQRRCFGVELTPPGLEVTLVERDKMYSTCPFSNEVLADIRLLREQLTGLAQVESVISLLDVPLVESPPMTLAEIARKVRTLESDDVDIELAEREMRHSPLYQNLLVNSQGDTTALQVNLVCNQNLKDLIDNRDKLYEKAATIPDKRPARRHH